MTSSFSHAASPPPPRLRCLVWRHWVFAPLARGLSGFPLALATIVMGIFGGAAKPAAVSRRSAHRFGPLEPSGVKPGNGRAVVYGLAILVPTLVAFTVSLLVLFLAWSGWLYPLKPELLPYLSIPFTPHAEFENAWGGPTLVGAWFIHAMAAIGMQLLCLAFIAVANRAHNVIARRLLP